MAITANDVVGTWALVDWRAEADDGSVEHPFGPDAVGVICYTDEGFVHVHIMQADRAPFAISDTMAGTPEEDSAAAKSHISYSGRFRIEGDRIVHDVAISSVPHWSGSQQNRNARFVDDRLELSTDPIPWEGKMLAQRLLWRRAA